MRHNYFLERLVAALAALFGAARFFVAAVVGTGFFLFSVGVFSFFGIKVNAFLSTGAFSLTSTKASTFASSSSANAPSSPPTTSALFALSKTRSSLKPYLAYPSVSAARSMVSFSGEISLSVSSKA